MLHYGVECCCLADLQPVLLIPIEMTMTGIVDMLLPYHAVDQGTLARFKGWLAIPLVVVVGLAFPTGHLAGSVKRICTSELTAFAEVQKEASPESRWCAYRSLYQVSASRYPGESLFLRQPARSSTRQAYGLAATKKKRKNDRRYCTQRIKCPVFCYRL